jgi:hypothetical protein
MLRVYAGALPIIAGIAGFILADRNRPIPAHRPEVGLITPASGLSTTAYDLLRIGAWALVIIGVLTVILGLIRYEVHAWD